MGERYTGERRVEVLYMLDKGLGILVSFLFVDVL
jgi:hypothetical protein